ncbi:MAG: LacI family transcriptional regulator [Acidobacteria bacterium]|nr:LacI family transcriptional regulator [Acidobacteriota bacterium]
MANEHKIDAVQRMGAGGSLKDLAAHLGLSQTTVSRVINNSGHTHRISVATQKRVLAAAAEMNYKASPLARGLRSRRSQTIGVMVPEISGGYAATVLSGIEDVLLLSGYFYFVVSHHHRSELLRDYPTLLLSRAVEGIIAVDSALDVELTVPVVAVSGHRRSDSILNIELDHTLAARYALEHLFRLGHRNIAFIKGQSFSSDTQARWAAIVKVAAEIGVPIHPKLVIALEGDNPTLEPGRVATHKLLSTGASFTAVFAFNDLSAMGAIVALREAGLDVPMQVSVVGFDDILGASTNHPPLTTVRQPMQEMGRAAATALLQRIDAHRSNEPQPENRHSILVLPTFVERNSTAPAPGMR